MAEGFTSMQLAFTRACERKLGKKIPVKSAEDVRVLARTTIQTYSPETLVFEDEPQLAAE